MMEREAFLMKPNCQCHLCQWGKGVYGAHHKEKGDYYMNSCLS